MSVLLQPAQAGRTRILPAGEKSVSVSQWRFDCKADLGLPISPSIPTAGSAATTSREPTRPLTTTPPQNGRTTKDNNHTPEPAQYPGRFSLRLMVGVIHRIQRKGNMV